MKVLVTNSSRNTGLAIMRALDATGWEVHGADDRTPPFGLHSRSAAARYALLPTADAVGFGDALLELLRVIRPQVLIPTRGVEVACRRAAEISAISANLLPSVKAFETLNDKRRLLDLCNRHGVGVPLRFEVQEAVQLLTTGRIREVVAKPCRDVGGGEDVHFIGVADDLAAVSAGIVARHGAALVTEVIPGPTSALRGLHLLFDARSRLISFFVQQKTRIWPPRRGVTAAASSTHEVALVEMLLPMFQELEWRGPADVDLKIDARDGRPRVIEINPRFSGALNFPIACGVNMPDLLCRASLGEVLPEARQPAYAAGRRYVDTGRWLKSVWTQRAEPGNLHGARAELAGRVPPVWRGDTRAQLGKMLMSVPGLARRYRND